MQTITEIYLDLATEFMKLCNAGKSDCDRVKELEKEMAEHWNKMTEQEKLYVDEQTIRISQWL